MSHPGTRKQVTNMDVLAQLSETQVSKSCVRLKATEIA